MRGSFLFMQKRQIDYNLPLLYGLRIFYRSHSFIFSASSREISSLE